MTRNTKWLVKRANSLSRLIDSQLDQRPDAMIAQWERLIARIEEAIGDEAMVDHCRSVEAW